MGSIYDIADKVGLSASTVARALRGKGYVSAESKELILRTAVEMDYIPTHAAKMLKSKRTNKILFCIPDIYNPFYFGMIKGVSDVLEQNGYFTILCHTGHRIEEEIRMIQSLRERYGDGMVLVSFNFTKRNIDAVNACGMPVVLTNRFDSPDKTDRFDYVYIDTHKGIRMATEHHLANGHRRIGYVGGRSDEQTGAERLSGYKEILGESGIPIARDIIIESDYTRKGGYEAGKRLLALQKPPTAVVAANDLMAVGLLQACEDAGLSIPGDISLSGMDDTDLGQILRPHLTTVKMREEDIGSNAAKLLLERILDGRTYQKTVRLEPELVVRQSSGSCRRVTGLKELGNP